MKTEAEMDDAAMSLGALGHQELEEAGTTPLPQAHSLTSDFWAPDCEGMSVCHPKPLSLQ